MKKIIIYIVSLLAWAFFGMSCNDYLDEMPDNRAEVDTKEKVAKLLVTAYPDASATLLAEMYSDNVDDNGSTWGYRILEQQAYEWQDITETDTDGPSYIWQKHYKAISSSNLAIDVIENTLGDTPDLAALKAEALITRAYSHFVLVNLFSKAYNPNTSSSDLGIPYITYPEKEVRPQYERGTVAGVYEMIEKDIEAALPYIDDNTYNIPKYHFNLQAAYAFAARFYLFYNKPDMVIKYADMVLTSNPQRVLRDWSTMTSSNGSVTGYAYINTESPATLLNLSAYSLWGRVGGLSDTWGMRYAHNFYIGRNETGVGPGPWGSSAGSNIFYSPLWSYSTYPKLFPIKLVEFFEITDPVSRTGYAHIVQPMFTTDETLLCRAEAHILKKDYTLAVNDLQMFINGFTKVSIDMSLNSINKFYGPKPDPNSSEGTNYYTPDKPTPKKSLNDVTYTIEKGGTQENMIHCVLHMRRLLTLSEGMRLYDIKRHGIEIYRRETTNTGESFYKYTDVLKVDDPRRAIQLPSDVINAGLAANPR